MAWIKGAVVICIEEKTTADGSWQDFIEFVVYQLKILFWGTIAIEICKLLGNLLGIRP